ncbi:type IV conjugative transfer system protein TraL [Thiotrichales bacterium 19S11-10]|nr:type IV conjugative transfer system protein TraL [Thiotrichales bacterium 19S11-10]
MDRSELGDFYRVSRYLNQPKRILGCTMDEFIPGAFVLFLGFISAYMFIGLIMTFIWIFSIKTLKKRFGSAFILTGIYWYCPKAISKQFFKQSPPSEYKFWQF